MSNINPTIGPLFDRNKDATFAKRRADAPAANFLGDLLQGTVRLAGAAAPIAAQFYPGVGGLAALANGPLGGQLGGMGAGGLGAGGLGAGGALGPEQLLMLQQQTQARAQAFQLVSNVSKTEHDSKMNAVRNVRP